MITIVAPTAMIAKKLASVRVWMSVFELKKLLTVAPVSRSAWRAGERDQRDREQRDHDDESRLLRRRGAGA